jgi:hypothetical protein
MKNLPTQLSQVPQWEARGGRNILQVKQYLDLTVCPLITTSFVRGGGRNVVALPVFTLYNLSKYSASCADARGILQERKINSWELTRRTFSVISNFRNKLTFQGPYTWF